MPSDANIPYEWQVGSQDERLLVVVPSWSQTDKSSYLITLNKETRELQCECKGFAERGICHHVKGLKWFCCHPMFRRKGVSRTSIDAFYSLTKEMLQERQEKVLMAIEKLGPISDKQIAIVLGWPINTVTPRRGEIEDMGLIECVGEQLDSNTQRHEMTWSVA